MSGYSHQVNFERIYRSGPLAGRRYTNQYLRLCSLQDAEKYAALCDGKQVFSDCTSGWEYVQECPLISELE
jgi:hypothetical protein